MNGNANREKTARPATKVAGVKADRKRSKTGNKRVLREMLRNKREQSEVCFS
jgi:hypothetical protein